MAYSTLELTNSTIAKWARGKFIDNISKRVPFFNFLRKKKAFAYWDGAGTLINEEALMELPGSIQALGPYEEITLVPQESTRIVPFTAKELVQPITITIKEMDQNSGREKMIDMLKTKTKAAELSFAASLESMLFSDGTAQGGKVLLGLGALIPSTSASGTLGGFDRSDSANAWIRCPTVSGAKTSIDFDNLRSSLANLSNTCTYGTSSPDIYITHQTVYEGYEGLYFGKWMPESREALDLGFKGGMTYRGQPVVFGDYVSAGEMFVLNSEALKLRVKGLKNSEDSPFEIQGSYDMRPHQKAYAWLLCLDGALTMNMFRQCGKIYGIN